jgi:hypothetical protein
MWFYSARKARRTAPARRSPACRPHLEALEDRTVPTSVTTFVTSGSGGLNLASELTFGPDGNLYVSGAASGNILRYDGQTGAFLGVFVPAGEGGYNSGGGLVFRPDGYLYATSSGAVLRFNATTGAFVDAFVAGGSGGLNLTFGPDGNGDGVEDLYVTNHPTGDVMRYDGRTGAPLPSAGNTGAVFVRGSVSGLSNPIGLAFGPDGNLYVAGGNNDAILKYDKTTGAYLGRFAESGGGRLHGLVFRPDGYLYVTKEADSTVRRYDASTGALVDVYIASGEGGLSRPSGLTFGPDGALYVNSWNTSSVLRKGPNPSLSDLSATQWDANQPGYAGSIAISGDTGPYSNLHVSGLPAGLSATLAGSTITLSGTPTQVGTFNNIVVSVADSAGGTGAGTYSLTISPALSLGSLSATQWDVNQPGYTGSIALSGGTGPYSNLAVTGLPPGLSASLAGSTISLSGTPTQTGTFNNIVVSLADSGGGTDAGTYSLTINPALSLGGLSSPSQWDMNQPGYTGSIALSGGTGSYDNLQVSGLPAGLGAALVGNTITLSGTPTQAGTFSNIVVSLADSAGGTDAGTYSLSINPALTLGGLSGPGQWGLYQPGYAGSITVSGGTGVYSNLAVAGLPAGLSAALAGNTISLSGTPTQAGTFSSIAVSLQDSNGATVSMMYGLTITDLSLSGTSVWEFRPVGTVVGTFSSTVPSTQPFTCSLVSGPGATDNGSFTLNGNQLLTADAFDSAAKSSYSIRVRSTDPAGHPFEQVFTITITDDPALTRSGRTLTVAGTKGNDSFSFTYGAVRDAMTLNGTSLAVDTVSVDTVVFTGGGGSDTAALVGTGTGETATLGPNSGQLQGSGYTVRVSGVYVLGIQGGAGEVAYFSDTTGNATFQALPGNSILSGSGYYDQALGFGAVVAGSSGGSDRATLYGQAGASFLGTPRNSQVSGSGLWEQATGFQVVIASGGQQASLYGSAAPDTFVGRPDASYLAGPANQYWVQASAYAVVYGSGAGGSDQATFYDSAGNDTFLATPGSSYMTGPSPAAGGAPYWNQVYGFAVVYATHSGGSGDRAYLYGSAGNDTFVATPTSSYLAGPSNSYWEQVYNFPVVLADGQGGVDVAQLYDSAGSDTFVATPTSSYLAGPGNSFWNQVFGFASVFAVSRSGGNDTATLYDSPGNDGFVGQGAVAYLSGPGPGLSGPGFLEWSSGFRSVTAVSSGGGSDTADLYTLDFLFAEIGPWLNRQH